MQDVTSDMISQVTERLLARAQAAAVGMPINADLPVAMPSTSSAATTPQIPDAVAIPWLASVPLKSGVPGLSSVPESPPQQSGRNGLSGLPFFGLPNAAPQFSAFPGSSLPGLAAAPEAFSLPGGLPTTSAGGTEHAGLRDFVQKVQGSSYRDRGGLCIDQRAGSQPPELEVARSAGEKIGTGQASRPLDVPQIRRDFPILQQRVHGKPLAWFDNAATTQKPQSVIDAISQYYSRDNSNIHRAAHTLAARSTDAFEKARQKVQHFLGAGSSDEILFVRGTTEGINLVTQTYGKKFLQPGDEIILSTLEHHANIVPWQTIAREKGAVLRIIPVNDRGEIMLEEYQALLGSRTKVVALTHASNSLGTVLPVAEMTQLAKRYHARVLIDGAQTVAHIPVNVQQLDCDFYVFSGHKIFGPTGIGAVFAKSEMQKIMPPWQGGGNMIKNVTFEETTFAAPPAKFEAGTPNIADAVGLGAALDYVSRLGLTNIARYEHALLEYATEALSKINGLRIIGTAREKIGVVSFVLQNHSPEAVGRALDAEGIAVRSGHHCSQPSLRRFGVNATVRPSFAFYNTFEEIDRLADTVRRI